MNISTRRPASTGVFFAQLQIISSTLQMGKNETTVLMLVETSIPPLNSILYAKGYHSYPLRTFSLRAEKFRGGTPLLCFVSENNQW